jgi:hypothetical protein
MYGENSSSRTENSKSKQYIGRKDHNKIQKSPNQRNKYENYTTEECTFENM